MDNLTGINIDRLKKIISSSRGNVLIMGVTVISILSIYGVAMTYRMIIDADISSRLVAGNRAFYLADSGIRWARRYLDSHSSITSLGPFYIADGEVFVDITHTTVDYPNAGDQINVYRIVSSASVGPTTRIVEEFRFRGGLLDKVFLFWREDVAGDY